MGIHIMLFDLIKALLGVLVPVLYAVIANKWPDFPLTSDNLFALAIWLAGLLFSGANLNNAYLRARGRLKR
jgi:uncharacterized membrane protein YagU involved in acid resistance